MKTSTSAIWAITFLGATGLIACGDDETASTGNTGGGTTTSTTATTTTANGGAGQGGAAQGGSAQGGDAVGGQGGNASGGNGTGGNAGKQLDITIIDGLQQQPAPAVSVCEQAVPNNCGNTDAMGKTTLIVTANQETILEYNKTGFRTHLLSVRADAGPTVVTLIVPNLALNIAAQQLGTQLDPAKGHVVGGLTSMREGATAVIDPPVPVIYLAANGSPDASLQATSTSGAYAFLNAAPGRGVVSVNQPNSVACQAILGIPAPGDNTVDIPIQANAITVASTFDCP